MTTRNVAALAAAILVAGCGTQPHYFGDEARRYEPRSTAAPEKPDRGTFGDQGRVADNRPHT